MDKKEFWISNHPRHIEASKASEQAAVALEKMPFDPDAASFVQAMRQLQQKKKDAETALNSVYTDLSQEYDDALRAASS